MVSDEAVAQSSISQYNQMIAELRQNNLLANNTADGQRINQIGRRISRAVEQYLTANGMQDKIRNLQWEFNLIKSKDINAFALPGGKIAFYTGILPVLKTDAAIAFVMGHEIGHVINATPPSVFKTGIIPVKNAIFPPGIANAFISLLFIRLNSQFKLFTFFDIPFSFIYFSTALDILPPISFSLLPSAVSFASKFLELASFINCL